ncbi:MAG: agmatinase [Candidatus Methanomethyliaceae archaeon]|nr:agmatinase [Candidatus Methanomethyliaceae archaeon]MDW7970865.1 agmatinase [Nitrososphaerota archaeon]
MYISNQHKCFGGFNKSFSEAKFVLFGVPFDSTASYRPGSRFGPAAIREASANIETWSWRNNMDFEDVKIHDVGDISIVHGDCLETIKRIKETVEEIHSYGKIPIMIGGEHTITLGAIRGLRDVAIISFDAHFDMRDEYLSNKLSHACVMRRILEELGNERLIIVGARATYKEEIEYVKENNIFYITSHEINSSSHIDIISKLRDYFKNVNKIYVSIDMDVLDPSNAPGVSNPEPEGISTSILLNILEGICDGRIVGFDVVEISPPYDNGITSVIASKIIYEMCCFITSKSTSS